MRRRFRFFSLSAVLAQAGGAVAAPLAVVNPGFEDIAGEAPFNEFTFGPLAGWGLYDPDGVAGNGAGSTQFYIGTLTPQVVSNPGVIEYFPGGAPEGGRVGIAFNDASTPAGSAYGMVQVLAATVAADTAYTLEVAVGNIASGTSANQQPFNLSGFPGYRVDLLAVDALGVATVLQSDNNTLSGAIPEGEFRTSTVHHATGASPTQLGQQLGIRLVNLNLVDAVDPAADREVDFDDVRLDASPVPEPGSLLLAGAGGLMVLRRRRGGG